MASNAAALGGDRYGTPAAAGCCSRPCMSSGAAAAAAVQAGGFDWSSEAGGEAVDWPVPLLLLPLCRWGWWVQRELSKLS